MTTNPTPTFTPPTTNRRSRLVIITIDTMLAIIKDYAGGAIPADATAVSLRVNPQEKGKFMLVIDSPSIPAGTAPMMLHFDIKRYFSAAKVSS